MANARQLNMNNAAIAPTWKRPSAMQLIQLILSGSDVLVGFVLTRGFRMIYFSGYQGSHAPFVIVV